MQTGNRLHFASLSRYALFFEHRSGAYTQAGEQRSTATQGISAKIVENVNSPYFFSNF